MNLIFKVLYILFGCTLILSGYIVVVALIPEIINQTYSFEGVAKVLSPFVLSLGVSIALVTLYTNRKDKKLEIADKNSEFYFSHCKKRIEEARIYFDVNKSNLRDEFQDFNDVAAPDDFNLLQTKHVLEDVFVMEKEIFKENHKIAFTSQKKNMINHILKIFSNLPISYYTGINWKGGSLEEQILNYNEWLNSERIRMTSSDEYDDFMKDKISRIDENPFSRGKVLTSIFSIINYCLIDDNKHYTLPDIKVLSTKTLEKAGLYTLSEYWRANIDYSNRNGEIIKDIQ